MATCSVYISSISASEVIAGQEWSGLKMSVWAGNLVPASLRVPSGRLLVCITAQGGLLLKITHWQVLKVVQRATIATVGCCPTAKHVVRDDRTAV